jgi:hypothetical protein
MVDDAPESPAYELQAVSTLSWRFQPVALIVKTLPCLTSEITMALK